MAEDNINKTLIEGPIAIGKNIKMKEVFFVEDIKRWGGNVYEDSNDECVIIRFYDGSEVIADLSFNEFNVILLSKLRDRKGNVYT